MNKTDKNNISSPISNIFKDERFPLANLCKKANSIQEINQNLKKSLDPSLNNHFELANIETDTATILVSSSTWATRLRYNIPAILNALNNELNFTSIQTVRIRVKKSIPDHQATLPKNSMSLSENSAQILIDVANDISDVQLRNCIIKLSKNVKK
jgi:hypothetical protein